MDILNQIGSSIIILPFTILIFLPAIVISAIILLIIFYKKKAKIDVSPVINTNETILLPESTWQIFVNEIFKKDKVNYYRYFLVIAFLLVVLIGFFDPVYYCSYEYSMIFDIAIIVSVVVLLNMIKKILVLFNIKLIIYPLITITFVAFAFFVTKIFMQDFHGWGDNVGGDSCYSLKLPSKKIEPVSVVPETKVINTFKYDPNGPYPSPLVNGLVNARGEIVDKWINGTFKTIGENKTFEYKEKISPNYASTIDNCIKTNCKKTYFADDTYITYGSGAKFNDTDNPAVGKIAKIDFYSKGKKVLSYPTSHDMSDSVTYTILYSQNDKTGQTITYSEDLCVGTKGGGQYCHDPYYKIGAVAIFLNKEKKSSLTASQDSIFFTGEITEAELVSYQYYMTPDTGEVFPVVKR
jgi:hypothetical protein